MMMMILLLLLLLFHHHFQVPSRDSSTIPWPALHSTRVAPGPAPGPAPPVAQWRRNLPGPPVGRLEPNAPISPTSSTTTSPTTRECLTAPPDGRTVTPPPAPSAGPSLSPARIRATPTIAPGPARCGVRRQPPHGTPGGTPQPRRPGVGRPLVPATRRQGRRGLRRGGRACTAAVRGARTGRRDTDFGTRRRGGSKPHGDPHSRPRNDGAAERHHDHDHHPSDGHLLHPYNHRGDPHLETIPYPYPNLRRPRDYHRHRPLLLVLLLLLPRLAAGGRWAM